MHTEGELSPLLDGSTLDWTLDTLALDTHDNGVQWANDIEMASTVEESKNPF